MRVFVTGASGWIGSAVVDELLGSNHQVIGLARSDRSTELLEGKGAVALRGDLDDLDALHRGAEQSDGVVHLANKHDFGPESDRAERAAVEAMGSALVGTGRPFLVANGLSGLAHGRSVLETDASPEVGPTADRGGSENFVLELADHGVRSASVRFAPSVHGEGDWGFVTMLANVARERQMSGYIGDGSIAWSAVHRSDAARLVRLGLEGAPARSRLHAVAEEIVPTRLIAEALGQALELPSSSVAPQEADEHFGFMSGFFGLRMTASSVRTQALLGWTPTGPTLLDDIRAGAYGRC